MATAARQPFAPLDSTRLQTLTSIKNRQNSTVSTPPSAGKRKAVDIVDDSDFENVDPVFIKRTKTFDICSTHSKEPVKDIFKPSVPASKPSPAVSTRSLPASSSRIRSVKQTKSPISKLNAPLKSSPLSPPAGRSPTRSLKRSGLSTIHHPHHRRATSSYSRIGSPLSSRASVKAAPFSLDAALKGTIPGFTGLAKSKSKPISSPLSSIVTNPTPATQTLSAIYLREYKPSWDFVIHEDTPQEHATNMLQHSTCVLDLSSDDETKTRADKDHAEGRDKENVPPPDDASQTSSSQAAARANEDAMIIEQKRTALADLDVTEFYAEGCDESSIFVVPADEETDAEDDVSTATPSVASATTPDAASPEQEEENVPLSQARMIEAIDNTTVEELLSRPASSQKEKLPAPDSVDASEGFNIWESESDNGESQSESPSADDETSPTTAPTATTTKAGNP
ncbi:hypothetical protein CFIMG_001877RA [Ceratocystis fimbriata CBS 114723]|uniref:Uncharacterized protein n=1 Tax=Ceratocystis fimbriata CBS 114723 TaxID=1035309 RepID=A0A2C5X1R4_9PEZI|nr:hypothetical protein CFIMG_001877RA [Ceratocystis fimbriata CBS 114723]